MSTNKTGEDENKEQSFDIDLITYAKPMLMCQAASLRHIPAEGGAC